MRSIGLEGAARPRPEDAANLKKASQQFTVVKTMGLRGLTPGKYVQIKVTDNIKKQSFSQSAPFLVMLL